MNARSDNTAAALKLVQASMIRLVKLRGLSITRASGATGQSAARVTINMHRGLKKMVALTATRDGSASNASECRVMLREDT